MYNVESVTSFGVYVMAVFLLESMYMLMRRRKLKALGVEAGFEVKELKWYERWIPAEIPDKRARILEAILWTLNAVLIAMGWLYWNDVFFGTPGMPLAMVQFSFLVWHVIGAGITYWLEKSYSSLR